MAKKYKKDKSKIKLVLMGFIAISIPLTVVLANQVQNYINHAADVRKMALGISMPYGVASKDEFINLQITEIERLASPVDSGGVGAYPASYSIWTRFDDRWSYGARSTFPNEKLLKYLDSKGITPMVFMEPVGYGSRKSDGQIELAKKYSNESIANGSMDSYFIEWANAAKAYGNPIILRYAQEMNGTWFPWSPYNLNSNGKDYYDVGNTPDNYVAMWKHIYNVVKPIAPNVKFFWCPVNVKGPKNNDFIAYYPGNDYVDYVGFDAYNWYPQKSTRPDLSLSDLYENSVLALREVTTGSKTTLSKKPIIIGETGIIFNNAVRDDRLNYRVIYNKFPDIAGITYFDIDVNSLFGVVAESGINWRLSGKSDNPENTNNGLDMRSKYAGFFSEERFQGKYNQTTLDINTFNYQPIDGSPVGYHDYATCNDTAGWTCDPTNFSTSLQVEFYADGLPKSGGKYLGSVTASNQRESAVGALCGGISKHGFKFNIPTMLKDGKKHTIYAFSKNTGNGYNYILEKSPKSITCQ